MTKPAATIPSTDQLLHWLERNHNCQITALTPLKGGYWSSAFSYRAGADAQVLRMSNLAEGFLIDQAAMRFASPNLPIPTVSAVGEAFGLNYAISERHYGRFIETTLAEEGPNVGQALSGLLAALRSVPTQPSDPVLWYETGSAATLSWHDWLRSGLQDDSDGPVSGWRSKLARIPEIERLFQTCEARIEALLPACPERRDLVHGDLLHQNVLVTNDAAAVTAIFSWKCSALGDFLYDVAWCTFWQDWHPGIAASDIWRRTLTASDLAAADLQAAGVRHHCYELQIGASHLGWNIWTGNDKDLYAVARVLEDRLERGPCKDS